MLHTSTCCTVHYVLLIPELCVLHTPCTPMLCVLTHSWYLHSVTHPCILCTKYTWALHSVCYIYLTTAVCALHPPDPCMCDFCTVYYISQTPVCVLHILDPYTLVLYISDSLHSVCDKPLSVLHTPSICILCIIHSYSLHVHPGPCRLWITQPWHLHFVSLVLLTPATCALLDPLTLCITYF